MSRATRRKGLKYRIVRSGERVCYWNVEALVPFEGWQWIGSASTYRLALAIRKSHKERK